ncbi:hypothetical protein [Anaerococcus tetradius]|uniref:hypothetical protein n=1 Tax=Anaerococcus tetradius TaxID=33036 RepID=UPI0023F01FC2|nr:hypothetical protein [Anaerococcus tetradius]
MKKGLEEFRREAYVDAIYAKMEKDNVVGVFSDTCEALLISYGFVAYPIIGLDAHIFDYCKVDDFCDPINSTIAYLKTQKCPLIYSSRFFVVDSFCEKFNTCLKKSTDKDLVYENDLRAYLENIKDISFDEKIYKESQDKLGKIKILLRDLEKSDIDGSLLYKLGFYIRFIKDLDERISFLKYIRSKYQRKNIKRKIIQATCPFEVTDLIDENIDKAYKIVKSKSPDFTFDKCIYKADKILTYKEK